MCAQVGNCKLRIGCHIEATQCQGLSSWLFRAGMAHWNSPSTAFFKAFDGSIIYWDTIGTFCSQVRIANSRASCLPSLDDRSFKCLWRCSWGAIAGHHDGSAWFKWHTLILSYLIWHPICSWLLPTCAQAVYSLGVPIDEGSFKCIQDAVDGLFQAPWLRMVQKLYLEVVLP